MAAPMYRRAPQIFRFFSPINHRVLSVCSVKCSNATATAAENADQIIIPKKIKRSPTAILEALAETVEKDPLGPHYRFMDDPWLIPMDSGSKRSYTLAKASGKKAAQWILHKYYSGFKRDQAAPSVHAFNPSHTAEKILTVAEGEEALRWMIHNQLGKDAFDYYQKLKEQGTSLQPETIRDLLEILCIYNSENKTDHVFLEEQWYNREVNQAERFKVKKTWKEGSPAEALFDEIPEKTPAVYRSLIRGLSKYNSVEKTIELYEEMVEKSLPIDVPTYRAVLTMIPLLQEESEVRWNKIENVLKHMNDNNVQPDLAIFNAVFHGLGNYMGRMKRSNIMVLQTLSEMKACGVEPSLGTWGSVISVFYSRETSQAHILQEILDHLEGQEFTLRHQSDVEFFRIAMLKCCVNMKDVDLAYKIDALLNTGRNHLLLGDSYSELIYYNQFFKLLCSVEELDKVMAVYDRCVPHIWSPGYSNLNELLNLLELYDAYQYVPQIWSDLVAFDYIRRDDLVEAVLQIMGKKRQEPKLQEIFYEIAKKHVQSVEETQEEGRTFGRQLSLTGPMLGHLVQIYLNSENFEDAWQVFEMIRTKKGSGMGFPSEDSLKQLSEVCVDNKFTEQLMQVLSVISDLAYPCASDIIAKAKTNLELTDSQKQQLNLMV